MISKKKIIIITAALVYETGIIINDINSFPLPFYIWTGLLIFAGYTIVNRFIVPLSNWIAMPVLIIGII